MNLQMQARGPVGPTALVEGLSIIERVPKRISRNTRVSRDMNMCSVNKSIKQKKNHILFY